MKYLIIFLTISFFSACNGQSDKEESKVNSVSEKKNETEKDSWKIVIPPTNEPGDQLIVSGIVYARDGKTIKEGITVHVYHTDMYGYYSRNGDNESRHRLNGDMITNSDGKYEFRTIKPEAYTSGNIPAHIHFIISSKDIPEQQFELLFEGDPSISERTKQQAKEKDAFFQIRPLMLEKDGILRCNFNITLRDE